jgi:hypothetical protein
VVPEALVWSRTQTSSRRPPRHRCSRAARARGCRAQRRRSWLTHARTGQRPCPARRQRQRSTCTLSPRLRPSAFDADAPSQSPSRFFASLASPLAAVRRVDSRSAILPFLVRGRPRTRRYRLRLNIALGQLIEFTPRNFREALEPGSPKGAGCGAALWWRRPAQR